MNAIHSPLLFITGASSGIGQALAAEYYAQGFRLALSARRGHLIRDWCQAQGFEASRYGVFEADVSNIDSVVAASQACIAQMGVPDVVVANAGVSIGIDTAEREDLDAMQRVFALNNVGLAATFHAFIKPMRERGSGLLVGISSVAGIRGLPGHGAYCASKAGVISYCESLRGELRGSGVQVTTLCPGYVRTPLTAKNTYPMPFIMDADEFAKLAFKKIQSRTSYAVIPWQMAALAKLLRILPNAIFDKALQGRGRKHRGA